ncbi:MAG: response regulator [Chloroflexota bacterium]|nr:response regulator [Chloroflexota bacterium]
MVEDDRSLRDLMGLVLEDEGFTVSRAANTSDAFRAIEAARPDVMMIDVNLSGEDGAALCRAVKSRPETASIKCMMWSSAPDLGAIARSVGADAWLVKPTDLDVLVRRIEDLADGGGRR